MSKQKTPQQMLQALSVRGLSSYEIANRVKVSQPTITRLLNGTHKNPSYAVGKKIEELYSSLIQSGLED